MSTVEKKLSIIICTYNRSAHLVKVLRDLQEQYVCHSEPDAIELVLVDNNSTDDTKEAIDAFIAKSKEDLQAFAGKQDDLTFDIARQAFKFAEGIKYVLETEQGSSVARNRGIKESSGELLAFLDDDIRLDANWLNSAMALAERVKPGEAIAFGARVVPDWEEPIPDWLNLEPPFEIIQSSFPSHNYGLEDKQYPFDFGTRKVYNPICANLFCSRAVVEKIGDFRLDLGITGSERGACEDTEFCWRMLANDIAVHYSPSCTVFHPIPESRMTKDFVLRWYKLLGKTLYVMNQKGLCHVVKKNTNELQHYDSALWLRFLDVAKVFMKLPIFLILWILSYITMDSRKVFWFRAQFSKTLGEIDGLLNGSIPYLGL